MFSRRFHLSFLAAGLLAAWIGPDGRQAVAQVQLDRLYPPAVAIGSETIVKADGKFPDWPATIVCDVQDVQITAGEESGQFKVVVPPGSSPGVAWIRVHDKRSASKLVPLCIEPRPVEPETEPNNQIDQANAVELPKILVGRLQKSGDVDTYRMAVRAGQTLVVSAIAHRVLGSPMDALLQLVDTDGNVIVQSDDVRGLDPQILYHADQDRELLVRIFAFPETPNSTIGFAGNASFVYVLRATTGPFVDHVLPLVDASDETAADPGGWNLPLRGSVRKRAATASSPAIVDMPEAVGWQWQAEGPAESIAVSETGAGSKSTDQSLPLKAGGLPCVFSGRIEQPGEVDRIRFGVTKGTRYRASVHARRFASALDSVLRIIDVKSGKELARNDDPSRNQYDAAVEYTAKADGEVELQVSDLVDSASKRHFYSVVIERAEPTVSLTLAADHFVVQAGQSVEIPVTISRLGGFNKKLQVTVNDLPAGVQVQAAQSEPKGASAKAVKLKLTAGKEAEYQGVFRVVAFALDAQDKPTGEPFHATYRLREVVAIRDVWLTVAAAK